MDEGAYDLLRLRQWQRGRACARGLDRRAVLTLAAAVFSSAASAALAAPGAARAAAPIVKPLPPELFTVLGTNAEMRWSAMAGQGHLVPIDRFFVRNHTSTPIIDPATWQLRLTGPGLTRGDQTYTYDQLRALPSHTLTAAVECAGNGRSFFTTQQGQSVSGTAWQLGAIGVARWRGVRLSTLLHHAGLSPAAVDVQPVGLDPNYVTGGVDLGPVRRPLPVAKALSDVLVAYEMNGEALPPDHGGPVRLVVPHWIGIASIKWLGQIEVSDQPLFSPWNTQFYRLFGPGYPEDGRPINRQVIKSAFELDPGATLPAAVPTTLTGRSWSATAPIHHVDISTDNGTTWRRARPLAPCDDTTWQRWAIDTTLPPGNHNLLARATDHTGTTQPDTTPYNNLGYLFNAVVHHPVTAA